MEGKDGFISRRIRLLQTHHMQDLLEHSFSLAHGSQSTTSSREGNSKDIVFDNLEILANLLPILTNSHILHQTNR